MPFMQVGTSCDPAVSRGIDYTFTWKERFENVAFAVLAFARWIHFHRYPDDLHHSFPIQMPALMHQLTDPRKPFYVGLLR